MIHGELHFDIKNRFTWTNCVGLCITTAAATLNQNPYIDTRSPDLSIGVAPIRAFCGVGAPTGTPTSFTATFTVRQGANSDGSASVAVADVRTDSDGELQDSLVLTAANTNGWLDFEIKADLGRYFGLRCVVAFVDGTTPAIPVFAALCWEKKEWP